MYLNIKVSMNSDEYKKENLQVFLDSDNFRLILQGI